MKPGSLMSADLCEGTEPKRENGFATGIYAGTGFQLIKRSVFERMIKAYPETKYKALHAFPRPSQPSDNLYALFDCMIDPETGVYLSEDYAFCRRWRAIGGEIWLDLQSRLNHSGSYTYRGNAAARFGRRGKIVMTSPYAKPCRHRHSVRRSRAYRFCHVAGHAVHESRGAEVFLLNSRSSLVPLGRNQCAGAAQMMKATHLMFFDTDMVFPADTLIAFAGAQ